jgi:hypothetical protein
MTIAPTLFTEALEEDPITHRRISKRCWNTLHQEPSDDLAHDDCLISGCNCACHDYID